MNVYMAARYERRDELRSYVDKFTAIDVNVVSSWVWNDQSDIAEAARADLGEIKVSDTLVFFSEDPITAWPRGSRCVEYGYALALGKRVVVIGPRENVFHWLLPDTAFFASVDDFVTSLTPHVYDKTAPDYLVAKVKLRHLDNKFQKAAANEEEAREYFKRASHEERRVLNLDEKWNAAGEEAKRIGDKFNTLVDRYEALYPGIQDAIYE